MSILLHFITRSLGSLLLLGTLQLMVQAFAFALVFCGKLIAPYDFFTTQAYDFLAKTRHACDCLTAWIPGLPDSFLGTGFFEHLGMFFRLLPAELFTITVLGILGGVVATVLPKRPETFRGWVLFWALFGLAVHIAAFIPSLSLNDNPTFGHILYRSRSLVVDGGALAMFVLFVSTLITLWILPLFEANKGLSMASVAGVLVAGIYGCAGYGVQPKLAEYSPSPNTQPPYNVLLISLDSLRADHLKSYGYDRDTSPRIDRLASEGIRFENAISTSSWTLPTHLTMFTGRYQTSHGVVHDTTSLAPSIPTLGEAMKDAGYATGGFISGPYVAPHYGYGRGMDTYVDLSAEYAHRKEARSAIVAPGINERALPWMEENKDERFFLFLHYFDIHYDFVPPAPFDTMFDPDYTGDMDGTMFIERSDVNPDMPQRDLDHILALYDGEIRFTDGYVGQILDKLEELGIADETLVILTSDHGDEFFEHGNKGHHRTVYDEVTKIPFIVRMPDGSNAGTVVEEQVSLVDIMPTILGVTGTHGPSDLEGVNVLDLLEPGKVDREAVYSEFYDKRGFNVQVGRRTADSKLIHHFNRITHPKRSALEYYDLSEDPAEQDDLSCQRPDAMDDSLDEMGVWLEDRWQIYREFRKRSGGVRQTVDISDETMEALKQLGYVGE